MMTRREALRRIGITIAGSTLASAGLFSLPSCETKHHRRVVLYFTGTGNCLYVARQLAGKEGEILSIPQLVKEERYSIEADEVGIVYPVYGHMPPNMVRRYIEKADIRAPYKFAVLTYGNRKCNAVEIWDEISRRASRPFDYISTLIMVDNWLPNFDMNEQMLIDKKIPENLGKISGDIDSRRKWHEPVTEEEREQHRGFLERSGVDPSVGFIVRCEESFEVSGDCIGCGACVSLCPRGNYAMTPEGVRMNGDCEFCFACIQNCPQKAILFARDSRNPLLARGEKNPRARYRNEHVSLADIKLANNQF